MLLYEKKIGYLSVYQDGERKSSAGFLKIERERYACRLEIHIKKGTEVYNGNYMLTLIAKDRELPWGTVAIRKEEGFIEKTLPVKEDMFCFENSRVREDEVCGISIRLGGNRWISGGWKETAGAQAAAPVQIQAASGVRTTERAAIRAAGAREESFKDQGRDNRGDEGPEEKPEERTPSDKSAGQYSLFEQRPLLHAAGGRKSADKWEKLRQSYKTVHPFGDERTFITMELRDFHILKPSCQKFANNSFLLHGFYNYRHLILGPDRELGGNDGFCFYLGVPGAYFEREKMVAVMFGFEGFECSGAVESGKFGYYMRRVEI